MINNFKRTAVIAASILAVCGSEPLVAISHQTPQQKAATKGKRTTGNSKGKTTSAPAARKRATSSKTSSKRETSADVRRQQEATQREIRLTEEQIRENEKSIKKGLNELGKLDGDISALKKRINETTGKINDLTGKIGSLETGITKNESDLQKLRDEYLKAVKKMRVAQKNRSGLAFIFASDNFNQALRRMRYLKQFSAWKDRQSEAINQKISELRTQRDQLAQAKAEQNKALQLQKTEQAKLQQQYGRQDALVAELRANGNALQTHLSKKQSEANVLRNKISALIAEEERKAAEERARQEAARKAEQERIAREEKTKREAEAAALAEKRRAQEEADAKVLADLQEQKKRDAKTAAESATNKRNEERAAKRAKKEAEKREKELAKKAAEERKQARKEAEKREKELAKREAAAKDASGKAAKNYADARKRAPRSSAGEAASASKSVASTGNFASMKGSLPRPVSGSFKVTSKFGRQSLPDLPDVVYDNPGIDAEVSSGASAVAVYGGKVSGVYMIPGYNTVVIVNHGNYYTVYGNISSPSVKVGDSVKAGQGLGGLAPDEDDRSHSSIHFEVWRNREKLNPLEWIRY